MDCYQCYIRFSLESEHLPDYIFSQILYFYGQGTLAHLECQTSLSFNLKSIKLFLLLSVTVPHSKCKILCIDPLCK